MTKSFEDVDMLDPATHDEPGCWELYDWMLQEHPLYWDPQNEIWWVARYDDIVFVARDPSIFTSTEGNLPNLPPDASMINQDGEQHRWQRGLVSKGFTPKYIRTLEDKIAEIVDELIVEMQGRGGGCLVEDLAAQLPMRLIGDMLGHPRSDHEQLRKWVDTFVRGGCGPQYVDDAVNDAFFEFADYHEQAIEKRKGCPAHDLLGVWLDAELDGQKLNEDQLLWEHTLLMVGGSETTRNAIAGGLEQLMRNPDQRAWLRQNPDGLANAIDEIVRWTSPFVRMCRTATRDVELHGKTIAEGQQIGMLYPAGNRDPRKFVDPHRFDIRREFATKPISFGYGAHYCLGHSLAKKELDIVLSKVLAKMPDLELAPGAQVERLSSSFIRGIKRMPVVLASARAAE